MRALCVAVFSNEEMDNFRHAARGHVQLEDLFDLAHFKAGLFDGLFADADFRLIVIEQARAGGVLKPERAALLREALAELYRAGLGERYVPTEEQARIAGSFV